MLIRTERLTITVFEENMAESVYINSLDEDNKRFVPDEVFETIEVAREKVKWFISSYQTQEGPYVYPIILSDGNNIGYVQAVRIPEGWEIGYHIAKDYTGKGFATEALTAFLPEIMGQLHISEVYGICLEENNASYKVMDKCGFRLEFAGSDRYQGNERLLRRYKYSE